MSKDLDTPPNLQRILYFRAGWEFVEPGRVQV